MELSESKRQAEQLKNSSNSTVLENMKLYMQELVDLDRTSANEYYRLVSEGKQILEV